MRSASPMGKGSQLHAALQDARRELVVRERQLRQAEQEATAERRKRKQQAAQVRRLLSSRFEMLSLLTRLPGSGKARG